MPAREQGAVAVDLGASSARFAEGWLQDGLLSFRVVEQIAHEPKQENGRAVWDMEALLGICRRAVQHAQTTFAKSTVGIDAWGVDHGFLTREGKLVQAPVCYRDPSHVEAFESLALHRPRLYQLTGIQHQPFNTICQLIARKTENPDLIDPQIEWQLLPDLLGTLLGAPRNYELTEASTTQLMGLDAQWSPEAFALAGWPVPPYQPHAPGQPAGEIAPGVRLVRVGSHDTASAVRGFGALPPDQAFLNLGTWSLLGTVLDSPLATPQAEQAGFTNERAVDRRVRFLKNIPGFYVVNRIHDELKIKGEVADWLAAAERTDLRLDLLSPSLFNPKSMPEACLELLPRQPKNNEVWAGLLLGSLADVTAAETQVLERLTGRSFKTLRLAGGGSKSPKLCQMIADASGRHVLAGPSEVTVLGNLGVQLAAAGVLESQQHLDQVLESSAQAVAYQPGVAAK